MSKFGMESSSESLYIYSGDEFGGIGPSMQFHEYFLYNYFSDVTGGIEAIGNVYMITLLYILMTHLAGSSKLNFSVYIPLMSLALS